MTTSAILYAILGGVVPTFVWLWFWLREDRLHPEPKHLIVATFVLGGLAVPFAIPFEQLLSSSASTAVWVLIGWALVEETLKYFAAYLGGMHAKAQNEPINAMIYLITAALGFAAVENTLFILQPFMTGNIFTGVVTANVRFVGTTLLHIIASATIGGAIAFSFYKRNAIKKEYFVTGFAFAVVLHGLFNYLILKGGTRTIFSVFALIWLFVIALLFVFERVKLLRR